MPEPPARLWTDPLPRSNPDGMLSHLAGGVCCLAGIGLVKRHTQASGKMKIQPRLPLAQLPDSRDKCGSKSLWARREGSIWGLLSSLAWAQPDGSRWCNRGPDSREHLVRRVTTVAGGVLPAWESLRRKGRYHSIKTKLARRLEF